MYKIVNKKPHFLPYDLCYVKGTKYIVLITEVDCNSSQDEDVYQWSYSVYPISKEVTKSAWYDPDELVLIKNMFEIMAETAVNNHSTTDYNFRLKNKRRK